MLSDKQLEYYSLQRLDQYIKQQDVYIDYETKKQPQLKNHNYNYVRNMKLNEYPYFPTNLDFLLYRKRVINYGIYKENKLQDIEEMFKSEDMLQFIEILFWTVFGKHFPEQTTKQFEDSLLIKIKEIYNVILIKIDQPQNQNMNIFIFFNAYLVNFILYNQFYYDRHQFTKQFLIKTYQFVIKILYGIDASDLYLFKNFKKCFQMGYFYQKDFEDVQKVEHEQESFLINDNKIKKYLVPLINKRASDKSIDFINDINKIFKKHQDIMKPTVQQEKRNMLKSTVSKIKKIQQINSQDLIQINNDPENQNNYLKDLNNVNKDFMIKTNNQQRQRSKSFLMKIKPNQFKSNQVFTNEIINEYKKIKSYSEIEVQKPNFYVLSPNLEIYQPCNIKHFKSKYQKSIDQLEIEEINILQKQEKVFQEKIKPHKVKKQNKSLQQKQKLNDLYDLKNSDISKIDFQKKYPQYNKFYENEILINAILRNHQFNFNKNNLKDKELKILKKQFKK